MKHHARLRVYGGWGKVPPGFAYDIQGAALSGAAQFVRVARYGETPNADEADTRPYSQSSTTNFVTFWNARNNWGVPIEGASVNTQYLRSIGTTSGTGGSVGISFNNSTILNPHAFLLPGVLAANESLQINAFIDEPDDDDPLEGIRNHQWWTRLGRAGAGILFRVVDGRPEILRLAPTWNRTDEANLRLLEALESPSPTEEQQIADLNKTLWLDPPTSLSFDSKLGRDVWRGEGFSLTLIPDPSGALVCILKSGATSRLIFEGLVATRSQALLWDATGIEVGATGGSWFAQYKQVRFAATGVMNFGPFYQEVNGEYIIPGTDSFVSASNYYSHNGVGSVAIEPTTVGEIGFGFRVTLSTTDTRYPVWLTAISAREKNGVRTGLGAAKHWDTDELSADSSPIMDARVSCDEYGRRQAQVIVRDIEGRASSPNALDDLANRVSTLDVDATRQFTQALITRVEVTSMLRFADDTDGIDADASRNPIYTHAGQTQLLLTIEDGNTRNDEVKIRNAIVYDGLHLGEALRANLIVAGWSNDEMAGISATAGPIITGAAAGELWAQVSDDGASVTEQNSKLMEKYSYGLRLFQRQDGVWVLDAQPSAVTFDITSRAAKNDPDLIRGGSRYMALEPLDFERDDSDYYTWFCVVGAYHTRVWNDQYALTLTGGFAHPRYTGREKQYEILRDEGLKTEYDVLYALRSLVFRYGNPGRHWRCESWLTLVYGEGEELFFVKHQDVVRCDKKLLARVIGYEYTIADDKMRYNLRELV